MALKTFSWNKNLIVPALRPRQCCRGAAVPGHQQPTGWPVTQEAPSSLTGAANDQPPWFCHACKHIFWSTGLLCTTPSPGQVTGYRCFTPGKGCPDAGNAGGLLQTHLPMPTHPEKPLVPATGTKNPLSLCHLRMPWARCSPGGHWLLSHTRTSVGKWARAQTRSYPPRVGAEGVLTGLSLFLHELLQAAQYCPWSL